MHRRVQPAHAMPDITTPPICCDNMSAHRLTPPPPSHPDLHLFSAQSQETILTTFSEADDDDHFLANQPNDPMLAGQVGNGVGRYKRVFTKHKVVRKVRGWVRICVSRFFLLLFFGVLVLLFLLLPPLSASEASFFRE